MTVSFDLGNRGFNREFFAVAEQSVQRLQFAHRTLCCSGFAEGTNVILMRRTKSFRDKVIQSFSQRIGRRAAKHLFRGCVEQHNLLVFVHSDDRIHRRGQDACQHGFVQPQRGGKLRCRLGFDFRIGIVHRVSWI